jgi:hypothetical protein
MPELFQFQKEGVAFIEGRKGRALLAHEMGLGKTVQALGWLNHRKSARPVVVICPSSVRLNWQREIDRWLPGEEAYLPRSQRADGVGYDEQTFIVIHYDIVQYWVEWLKKLKPKVLIVDECFPYNTMVLTELGPIEMGRIVEEKLDVKVVCSDLSSGCLSLQSVVHYFKIKRQTSLLRIVHEHGELVCTENHELWVENYGYVKASLLQSGDCLRVVREDFYSDELQQCEEILQYKLLSQMEDESSGIQVSNLYRRTTTENCEREFETIQNRGRVAAQKSAVRQNEEKQPYVYPRSSRESSFEIEGEAVQWNQRWEWLPYETAEDTLVEVKDSLGIRALHSNYENITVSSQLQSGLRASSHQDCDRDRWSPYRSERSQEEENKLVGISRVVSVEIYEPRDRSGYRSGGRDCEFVYCLEVEKRHNFFADGVLVSNCQAIKSTGAKRTKAVKKLAKGIRHVIGLTGTPIVNRPIEVFNILYIIDKTAIPNFHTFTRRYCAAKFNGFGWDYSGASNTKELHNLLTSSIVLRRRKEDVLTSLPPKIRSFVPLSLDNQAEYEAAEEDLISYLLETEGKAAANRAKSSPALVRISKLRMLAARGKLEQAIDWISDTTANHKLVVFGVHREIIDPVFEHFKKVAVKIAGDVSETDRQKAIDRFQTDPKVRLFVGQVEAAGVGITLTAASHIAFLELPWTPGSVLQAEDRIHRIGQEQPCVIYYLMAARTIDEDMAKLIDKKRSILNAVLDGSHDASPTILTELLAIYKKRRGKYGLNRSLNPEEVSNQVRLQDRHGNGAPARRGA